MSFTHRHLADLAPEPRVGGGRWLETAINRLHGGAGGLTRPPPWAVWEIPLQLEHLDPFVSQKRRY